MNFTITPIKEEERKYAYPQNDAINKETGCIGCFRGYLTYNKGIDFERYWDSIQPELQNETFNEEFKQLIRALKCDEQLGQILSGYDKFLLFCRANQKAKIEGAYKNVFGFRIETAHYLYLLRLAAQRKGEDFFIYAYKKSNLQHHLRWAADGIYFKSFFEKSPCGYRFILADGDSICIQYADGSHELRTCKYVNQKYAELNGHVENIQAFVNSMDEQKAKIYPFRRSLPPVFYFVDADGSLMEIRPGKTPKLSLLSGISKTVNEKRASDFNKPHNITPGIAAAMMHGATKSWADLEADPANYSDTGEFAPQPF